MGQLFIAFLAMLTALQGVQSGRGDPGDSCTLPMDCIDKCVIDTCKIAIGDSCDGNEEHCESSAFCEVGIESICRLAIGDGCSANKEHCESSAFCDAGSVYVCKIRIGKSCADDEDQCGSAAFCEEHNDRKICKAKLEEDCESSCDCPANAECDDDDTCKCESGYTASDDNTECSRGSARMIVPLAMMLASLVATRLF